MNDFVTLYRENYNWPATGRRLIRGPRPPPSIDESRMAIEDWEKSTGLCSAAWKGSDEASIGEEWMLAAMELQRKQGKEEEEEREECSLHQMDRIAMAKLRALQLERSEVERKIVVTDIGPKANRRKYTSTYQHDYTRPSLRPVDALWSFSDLIAMSRGVACEDVYDWPPPATDRSGDRCWWGEKAKEMPLWVKRHCHQRPTIHRACEGCGGERGNKSP